MKFNADKQKNHAIASMEYIQEKVGLLRNCLLHRGMESVDGVIEVMRYLDDIQAESEQAERYIDNLSQCVLTTTTP